MYQGWGSKSIIEKIEIFYEIENRKKIEKSIIKKFLKIEIEKRISIFFSINKFLYQKLFKRILNVN